MKRFFVTILLSTTLSTLGMGAEDGLDSPSKRGGLLSWRGWKKPKEKPKTTSASATLTSDNHPAIIEAFSNFRLTWRALENLKGTSGPAIGAAHKANLASAIAVLSCVDAHGKAPTQSLIKTRLDILDELRAESAAPPAS